MEAYDWVKENATNRDILGNIPDHTFCFTGIKRAYIENSEAKEWLESYHNQNIVNTITEDHGYEYNYVFIKKQVEAFEWLQENTRVKQTIQKYKGEFGHDYQKIKKAYTEAETSRSVNTAILISIFIIFPIWQIIYILPFLKDIKVRGGKRWKWLLLTLLTPPIAIALYLSIRRLKKGEKKTGSLTFHLSKNIMLPWAIYMSSTPLFLIFIFAYIESIPPGMLSTVEYVGEAMFWFSLIHFFVIIPVFVIIPIIIALFIMLLSKSLEKKTKT